MSAALIVPVLKARIPVDLQLEFPLPPGEAPLCEPLAGDVYVSYVLDFTERYEYVTPRRCAELGLTPATLRERATDNLRTRQAGLTLDWSTAARAVTITVGGGLESGLVLDDDLMDKLTQDVEGDLVVAVPARDVLVATGTGHQDGIAELRRAVDEVWQQGGGHGGGAGVLTERLVAKDLLVRARDGWQLLDRTAASPA
ncbi:MAG TPA: DUF1444 family protein [Streptosporangiaceae bacterium]|jgi:hypothetical protein